MEIPPFRLQIMGQVLGHRVVVGHEVRVAYRRVFIIDPFLLFLLQLQFDSGRFGTLNHFLLLECHVFLHLLCLAATALSLRGGRLLLPRLLLGVLRWIQLHYAILGQGVGMHRNHLLSRGRLPAYKELLVASCHIMVNMHACA